MTFFRKVSDVIEKIESFLIFVLVLGMVVLSFMQIVLRNLFAISIFWIDDFTRHAVLWVGLLAMSVATAHAKHINIDIISRFFKGKSKRVLNMIKYLVASGISGVLVYASVKFLGYEMESGEESLTLKVPIWYLEALFPVSFSLTSLRFILLALEEITGRREEMEKKEEEKFFV